MTGMELIGLELGKGVEPGHQGQIIGAFGANYVNPHLDLPDPGNLACHPQEFVPRRGDIPWRRIVQFEENDVGDHGNGPSCCGFSPWTFDDNIIL
jgi:hypothetical protein